MNGSGEYDFDKFLADATERQAQDEKDEQYVAQLMVSLRQKLSEQNVPRVTDNDPDVMDRLSREYTDSVRQDIYDALVESGYFNDLNDEQFAELVDVRCKEEAEIRFIKESLILGQAAMVIALHEHGDEEQPDENETESTAAQYKKRIMARLLVLEGMNLDDPIVRFFDEVTQPIPALDPDDENDQRYITEAMTSIPVYEEQKDAAVTNFEQACQIVGINQSVDSLENLNKVNAIGHIFRRVLVLTAVTHRDNEASEREAEIRSVARDAGFEEEHIKSLIAFIEQKYPLDNRIEPQD